MERLYKFSELADHDDHDDRGQSGGFSNKEFRVRVPGKFPCFCHNHYTQVSPISIKNVNRVSEVGESAW
jgi:hypothetical protein